MKVIVGLCFVIFCGYANAGWKTFYNTTNGLVYYDPDKVIKLPDGTVSAWMKFHIGSSAVNEGKGFDSNFNEYDHSVAKHVFDCSTQKTKLAALYYYDKNGKTFLNYTYSPEDVAFKDIIPESLMDSLAQLVCKKK